MELDSRSRINDPITDDAGYIGALVGRDNSNMQVESCFVWFTLMLPTSLTEMHKFLSWMAVCVTWVDIQSTRIINVHIVCHKQAKQVFLKLLADKYVCNEQCAGRCPIEEILKGR